MIAQVISIWKVIILSNLSFGSITVKMRSDLSSVELVESLVVGSGRIQ